MKDSTMQDLAKAVTFLQGLAQAVREDTNAAIATADHVEVIRHYNKLRIVNDQIKEARDALSDIADHLSTIDVPDVMRLAKVKTTTIEGVGRVTVSYRFSCSMLDKEKGMNWLRENGHGGLIQPTVNAQTLGAFAKNLIETEGKELPVEIFKTGTAPYTSITKVA